MNARMRCPVSRVIRWKRNWRTSGDVSGTVTMRSSGCPAMATSAMPTDSRRVRRRASWVPSSVTVMGSSPSSTAAPLISTVVSSVAVTVSSGSVSGRSGTSSSHWPSAGPGVGHHAVSSSPSTAAVGERAGSAPPKLVASEAEELARTCPPIVSTRVSGPAEG